MRECPSIFPKHRSSFVVYTYNDNNYYNYNFDYYHGNYNVSKTRVLRLFRDSIVQFVVHVRRITHVRRLLLIKFNEL